MRTHSGQFRSKAEAMNRRKQVWACKACKEWRYEKPEKNSECAKCGKTDFYYFPSKIEAKRFATLCLMQDHGYIRNLQAQVPYPIFVKGVKIATYYADFCYIDKRTGEYVVEDVKPKNFRTDMYKLKKKLVEVLYAPTKITEVTPP